MSFNPKRERSARGETPLSTSTPATPVSPLAKRFHTSVTDRAEFRTCRRRWYLGTIQGLVPKDAVTWYFIFGNTVHVALEEYYRSGRNVTRMLNAYERAWTEEDARLQDMYAGFYKLGIEQEWRDYLEKAEGMLRHYDQYDRSVKGPNEIRFDDILDIAIEERGFVPILSKGLRNPLPGPFGSPLLSGKIDLVVKDKDGGVWLVDHKAYSSPPAFRALDVDDQLTGYCYIYWRLTGIVPRGALFNVLIKDPPKPPRILKSGEISRDKSQRTTYELYLKTVMDTGQDSAQYEDILRYLADKGWKQFFIRDGVQRNLEELMSFENRLRAEYHDMRACLQDEEKRYPNPSQFVCPGCSVMAICQAMEEQGDVQWVIENGYRVGEPRYQIPEGV